MTDLRHSPESAVREADLSLPDLPVRPRLRPGLSWVVEGQAVALLGLDQPRFFRGKHAVLLLPTLFGFLDGWSGHEALATAAELSVGAVRKVLRQLHAAGVIEDLSGSEHIADTPLSDWYSSATARTGRYRSGRAAAAAMRETTIALVGGGALADHVARLLRDHGLIVTRGGRGTPRTLTVAFGDQLDMAGIVALDDEVAAAVGRWLHVAQGPERVSLGPTFDRRMFPCASCAIGPDDNAPSGPIPAAPADDLALYWSSCVVAEVLALVAGAGEPTTLRQIVDIESPGANAQGISVSPVPGCVRCTLPPWDGAVEQPSSGYVYEYVLAGLPEELHSENSHYGHYTVANRLLQAPQSLSMMDGGVMSTDIHSGEGTIPPGPWSRLSELLTTTYGLRPDSVRRYPPTGGNIGSPRALVWLDESAWGDRAGLHSYEPHLDALCRLQSAAAVRALLVDTAALPSTCLLQIADVARLEEKYGARGFRISWLDAGVGLEHFEMQCDALGIEFAAMSNDLGREVHAAAGGLARRTDLAGIYSLPNLRGEGDGR